MHLNINHGIAGKAVSHGWIRSILLFLLLLAANSSAIICQGDKIVHMKIPASWNGSVYLNVDGVQVIRTLTPEGDGWYSFNLRWAAEPSHDQTKFNFFHSAQGYNDYKIFADLWNTVLQASPTAGLDFTCADFGAGVDLYISEDLDKPGYTYKSIQPPNALYFHFLAPDESDWFQGTPVIVIGGTTQVRMVPDTANCGWYTATYFNVDPPSNIVISLDINPVDYTVGVNGLDDEVPAPIDLKAKFDAVTVPTGGKHLYFDPMAGAAGWTAVDPGDVRQCNYQMAAIVYDTDAALHGAFTCDNYPNVATTKCPAPGVTYYNASNLIPCIGVTKGIVSTTLGANKKPVYNPSSGCFASQAAFDQLFVETPNVNKKHCVDLKFSRTTDGLWEFDSYNEPGKGYYPLETEPNAGTGLKREAFGGILMGFGESPTAGHVMNNINLAARVGVPNDVNWGKINALTGLPFIDTYPTQAGEFADGKKPNVYNNAGWDACPNLQVPGQCREKGLKNQHFCFETHADFVYRKGQKFYFRGDDDIWVFINNKLVVDLGGTHLAAPDYVVLDTIAGIQENQKYPIDIFFCDRRTDMSNIRVKTNMYFEQKNSLYYEKDPATGQFLIKKLQTGGASCDAIIGGGGTVIVEGKDLMLQYRLSNSRNEPVDGDNRTPALDTLMPEGVNVWGGIMVSQGIVTLDTARLTLPPGRYRLTIQDATDPGARLSITFRIAGNTAFYSVNGSTDLTVLARNPAVDTLAGRMIKFQMAKTASGEVDPEGEASFQVMISSPDLLVFRDSAGTIPYNSLDVVTKADMDSSVSLWATSRKSMTVDTATYSLTLMGSKSLPIYLKFHMPRIAFVSDTNAVYPTGVLPAVKPPINGTALNWSFVNYPTYLVIYDPKTGAMCTDCNEVVVPTTLDSLDFQSVDGGKNFQFVNGRLTVMVRGTGDVNNGSFVVQGSIDSVRADWTPIRLTPPPTPRIELAAMYDKNGDGIADSLHVRFNRPVNAKESDMPDFMVIRWPSFSPDTSFVVGRGAPTPQYTGNPADIKLQQMFPTGRGNEIAQYLSADGLSMSIPYMYDSINTAGIGELQAWFSFVADGTTDVMQIPVTQTIADSMPPILRRANIDVAQGSRGADTLYVYFTESIDTTGVGAQAPFVFKLLSSNVALPIPVPPTQPVLWNRYRNMATLLYDVNSGLQRPREGDSVRIAIDIPYAAKDTVGNVRSLSNPFVRINGDKRPEIQVIYFAEFDETAKAGAAAIERTSRPSIFHGKIGMYDNPEQIKTTILSEYGPILGHVLRVDLAKYYDDFEDVVAGLGVPLTAQDVELHYEVYYHTNLGAYVAGGKGVITCADVDVYGGDCRSGTSRNLFPVVAWNLTSKDNRLIGSGPYLTNIKMWLTIPKIGKTSLKQVSKSKRMNFGAMRKAKGNLIKLTEPKD